MRKYRSLSKIAGWAGVAMLAVGLTSWINSIYKLSKIEAPKKILEMRRHLLSDKGELENILKKPGFSYTHLGDTYNDGQRELLLNNPFIENEFGERLQKINQQIKIYDEDPRLIKYWGEVKPINTEMSISAGIGSVGLVLSFFGLGFGYLPEGKDNN